MQHQRFVTDKFTLLKTVSNEILFDGGYIFGGYVRDTMKRSYFAKKLKKAMPQCTQSQYQNAEFSPMTKDRLTIPDDIDCVMTKKGLESFLKHISGPIHNLSVLKVFEKEPLKYLKNFKKPEDSNMVHFRYVVKTNLVGCLKQMKTFCPELYKQIKASLCECEHACPERQITDTSIKLDVLCVDDSFEITEPFFAEIDFECNGLYYKGPITNPKEFFEIPHFSKQILPDTLSVDERIKKIDSIMSDIYNNIAVCVSPDNVRLVKMKKKGYTLVNMPIREPFVKIQMAEDECIVCLEVQNGDGVKSICCGVKLDMLCYDRLSQHNLRCPICKKTKLDKPSNNEVESENSEPSSFFVDIDNTHHDYSDLSDDSDLEEIDE